MTCQNCENCKKKEDEPTIFKAMTKAGEILEFLKEHEEHPRYERILYPNRIAVGGWFLGIHRDDEFNWDRILFWESDKPEEDAVVAINGQICSLVDPDKTPPMLPATEINDLMAQFKYLLENEFFQG